MNSRMLILNLGSTSTKVAVYDGTAETAGESLHHSQEELAAFSRVADQKELRKTAINRFLQTNGFDLNEFACIVARGGCSKPIEGGVYYITEDMLTDIKSERYGVHVSNVGCIIAYELGQEYGLPVITADTIKTDEFGALARYSGLSGLERVSTLHALNQKAIARRHAESVGKKYEDMNLIVAHMGGGISVGAHQKGKAVDANNALDGDGPFSPERAGTLPVGALIHLCFSGKYSEAQLQKMICGGGGLMSYLGTNSGLEVEERIQKGEQQAAEVYEAMAYQIAKEIGSAACVLSGQVDAILLTGSLSYSKMLTDWVKDRVAFLAPVYLYPGENEMLSLAESGMRFLSKKEQPKIY